MTKLLLLMAAVLALAYVSEQNTRAITASGHRYTVWKDWAYILLVILLTLFSGLRTNYNDTWNYIKGFREAPSLAVFFADPENLNPFRNPLFYTYESLLKDLNADSQILIFSASLITQTCLVLFFKRYSSNFTFSIFLYFTLGTFSVCLGAMKQVLAMAVLTLAFPFLEKHQWGRYYLIVFLAMLIHTYAASFAVLPLFSKKPWGLFTYIFVAAIVALLMNFTEAITGFMEQLNEMGKNLEEYEVFDDNTVNLFRVAVYTVTPVCTFLFQKWLFRDSSTGDHVIAHMSIISMAFMVMGTQSGANMFGRMAHYFELGTICCLPWILKKTLELRSRQLVSAVAGVCFLGFFIYANQNFGEAYKAINLLDLFR